MPTIGLLFEICRAETLPGEIIHVSGNRQELGHWDPCTAMLAVDGAMGAGSPLQLRTSVLSYPCWSMAAPVWVRFGEDGNEEQGCGTPLSTRDSTECPSTTASDDGEENPPCSVSLELHAPGTLGGARDREQTLEIEYKYVKNLRLHAHESSPAFEWEDRIHNRRVAVPLEPGSTWLISDFLWNSDKPVRVTRIARAEMQWRRLRLDPRAGPMPSLPWDPCSHAVEDQIESKGPPASLADELAAEEGTCELASLVMCLQRESAALTAGKEVAEEEARALRGEVTELREALARQAGSLEAMRRENEELRAELVLAKAPRLPQTDNRHLVSTARAAGGRPPADGGQPAWPSHDSLKASFAPSPRRFSDRLEATLTQALSSLVPSPAPPPRKLDDGEETELMRVLRRRRERIGSVEE